MSQGANIIVCCGCPRLDRARVGPDGYWICGKSGRQFVEHARGDVPCLLGKHEGQTPVEDDAPALVAVTVGGEAIPAPHWGTAMWNWFHPWTLREAPLLTREGRLKVLEWFASRIPNCKADCRNHWLALVTAKPPPDDPAEWFAWGVDRHNDVSRDLVPPKPEWTHDEALARWSGEER